MIEFRLPSLGSDMDEGTLVEWHVQPGDRVTRGQVLAVVDTAKAAIDVECWHEGIVHALVAEPGTKLPVGALLAVLREEGESADAVERALTKPPAVTPAPPTRAPSKPGAAVPGVLELQTPTPTPTPTAAADVGVGARRRVTPAARRRAQALGIALEGIVGHGVQGAVTLADVEAVAQVSPAVPAATPPPSRGQEMRRVIAAAMSRSKREIPHYYLAEDVAFGRASQWLAERNGGLPPTQRLLPAAALLKAVARALQRFPEFNGFWRDGAFSPGEGIHVGVAISLREGGLVAPALRDVPALDLAALTRALLDLVKRTRAGALRSSELSDATITVTSLGDQGVDSVFGVIYPPQVALVGFGRVRSRAWVGDDGALRAEPVVTVTLAADHRASDGHRGALLLAEIRDALQDPAALDVAIDRTKE